MTEQLQQIVDFASSQNISLYDAQLIIQRGTGVVIKLTDDECRDIAHETLYSYIEVRSTFHRIDID